MDQSERARTSATWAGGDYRQLAVRLAPAAHALVEALGVGQGDRLLDVAAGTGNVGVTAALRGAVVTASDLTPRMLELGRKRAAAEGLALDWVEADAEDLPFPDTAFDLAASAFGVIFVPHPAVAVAELHRVLRPGGRLGLTTWPADGHMARMTDVVLGFFPPRPAGAPDPGTWGTPDGLRALLEGPFADVAVRTLTLPWRFPTAAAARAFLERHSPAHVAAAAALPPAESARMLDALEALYAGLAGADGAVDVAAEYLLITATRRP